MAGSEPPKPRKRRTTDRWTSSTPEERKAHSLKATRAHQRQSRERQIAGLLASAPPLAPEVKARLGALLNAIPDYRDEAAS